MGAVYPAQVRTFSTKVDLQDPVLAAHVNDLQDELVQVQNALGINVHGTGTPSTTNNVRTRFEAIEVGKSPVGHDHTNRLAAADHDVAARHTFGGALGSPEMPAALTVGAAGVVGDGDNPANERHVHPMPSALTLAGQVIPPGTVWATASRNLPAGWLWCDGAVKVRADFDPLFQAIGTDYNTGGEAGTDFRLPDLRNRFPMGRATVAITPAVAGGSRNAVLVSHNHPGSSVSAGNADHTHWMSHSHSTDWSANHQHSMYPGWSGDADITMVSVGGPLNYRIGDHDDPVQGPWVTFGKTFATGSHEHHTDWESRTSTDGASGAANHSHGLTIATQGVSATDANLPPYQTVNYIIKT